MSAGSDIQRFLTRLRRVRNDIFHSRIDGLLAAQFIEMHYPQPPTAHRG